jgi:hypothetical protein
MRKKQQENAPTFSLATESPQPWEHCDNVLPAQRLFAAQRVAGILTTKLERTRNTEYDLALRNAGVTDVELTGIEATDETVAHMTRVIHDLKTAVGSLSA